MSDWGLTVRHGSQVKREAFDDLGQAVSAIERHVDEIRAEGPLEGVRMLRDFEPSERVAARIELSTGGMLRRRDAGIDVMGDGALIAYAGGLRRRVLQPRGEETAFDAVRRELED